MASAYDLAVTEIIPQGQAPKGVLFSDKESEPGPGWLCNSWLEMRERKLYEVGSVPLELASTSKWLQDPTTPRTVATALLLGHNSSQLG